MYKELYDLIFNYINTNNLLGVSVIKEKEAKYFSELDYVECCYDKDTELVWILFKDFPDISINCSGEVTSHNEDYTYFYKSRCFTVIFYKNELNTFLRSGGLPTYVSEIFNYPNYTKIQAIVAKICAKKYMKDMLKSSII